MKQMRAGKIKKLGQHFIGQSLINEKCIINYILVDVFFTVNTQYLMSYKLFIKQVFVAKLQLMFMNLCLINCL